MPGLGQKRFQEIAAKYVQQVLNRYPNTQFKGCRRRGCSGAYLGRDGSIRVKYYPNASVKALYTLLHEVGHVLLGHLHRTSPENRDEYEAEQYAISAMRSEGVPIPDTILRTAQKDVAESIVYDLRRGNEIDSRAVRFAGEALAPKLKRSRLAMPA